MKLINNQLLISFNFKFKRDKKALLTPVANTNNNDKLAVISPSHARSRRWGFKILLVPMLMLLALSLCSCSIPGVDYSSPCSSSASNSGNNNGNNNNQSPGSTQAGCANPVQQVQSAATSDDNVPWYIGWVDDMIRQVVGNTIVSLFDSATYTFWDLFTKAGSTNFAGCGTSIGGSNWGAGSSSGPVCVANEAELEIAQICFGLVFFILVWNAFGGYFVNQAVKGFGQTASQFLPRIALAFCAIGLLGIFVTGAFGFSNLAFSAISGGPKELSKLLSTLAGNASGGGVANVVSPDFRNLALLLVNAVLIFVLVIELLCMGLTFFLRTILVYILFASGPLAIVASTEQTLRPWFNRWLSSMVSLLIAPIPVAVCLKLAEGYVNTDSLNSAITNTLEFIESLIFLAAFFFIAAVLQWKIAGQVGGFAFGVITSAAAGAGGWAMGKLMATKAISFGGKQAGGGSEAGAGGFESEVYTSTGALRSTTTPEALALGAGASPMALPAGGNNGGWAAGSAAFGGNPFGGGPGSAGGFDTIGRDLRSLTDVIAMFSQIASASTTTNTQTMAATNTSSAMMYMPAPSLAPSRSSQNRAGYGPDSNSIGDAEPDENWRVGPEDYRYSRRAAGAINTTLRWAGSQVGVGGPSYDFAPGAGARAGQGYYYDDDDNNYYTPTPPVGQPQSPIILATSSSSSYYQQTTSSSDNYWDAVYYGHRPFPGGGTDGAGSAAGRPGGNNIAPNSPTPASVPVPYSYGPASNASATIWTPPSYRQSTPATSNNSSVTVVTAPAIAAPASASSTTLPALPAPKRRSNSGSLNNNEDW